MNVLVEEAGPCRRKLLIEIPVEQVDGEYGQVMKSMAKGAKIPGFRPGKAPKNLVERHYGKEILEEVRDRLIPRGYQEAIKQKEIDAVAVLDVQDVECSKGAPMKFSVMCDVAPDFSLPGYKGVKLKGTKPVIKDEDIENAIKSLLEQRATFEDVEDRAVQQGDMVQIDYEGIIESKPIEEIAPDAKGLGGGKDFWVMADENAFLPEFAEGLVGSQVGEKKQIMVDFPGEFHEPSVAGKKATYFVDVKQVREKVLPEINEEFLKMFQLESEEDLRARVREDLEKSGMENENQRLKGELVKTLLEKTKLDVPESVVQEETRNTIYDIVRQNTMQGMPKEQIEQNKAELFDVAAKSASEKVKSRYILHKIAEAEKIGVTNEEISGRIAAMAAGYGVPPDQFRSELVKRQALPNVEEELRLGKTVDFLLDQAKIDW